MKTVVIDDERTFSDKYAQGERIYLRNSSDALVFLAKHWVEYTMNYGEKIILFLDHDLGEGDDIRIVVDFLCVSQMQGIEAIFIHSQNPVSEKLVLPLQNAGYIASKVPLPKLKGG